MRSVKYSDPTLFTQANGQIALKEYADNVVLYAPFDANLNAKYSIGISNAVTTGNPVVMNFGQFAQCVNLAGSVVYDATNFQTLADQGSIKFWIKATFNNAYGQQNFIATTITNPFTAGTYGFTLTVGSNSPVQISFDLAGAESFANIFSSISSGLSGYGATTNNALYSSSHIIQVIAQNLADTISITAPSSGLNLITLLGGVGPSLMLNAPSTDTTLVSIRGTANNNRIDLIHKASSSNIVLNMYDNSSNLIVNTVLGQWSNSYLSFYSFEFSFNDTMAQLFINGTLLGMAITGFTRQVQTDGSFILGWNGNDIYKIDELIVYNIYKHIQNYTPETTALTQYTTTVPYIDVDFGKGFIEGQISGMSIDASSNTDYVIQLGNQWYYYFSGAWYPSDGTFSQSISAAIIETQFSNLFFVETLNLTVRVYFESDGITPSYMNDITIQQVNDSNQEAMIFASIAINPTVDLSVNNMVTITTDQGSKQVNLASTATTPSAVTLLQIESAINAAHVPGLAPAKDDGNHHLVLESISTGIKASVMISNGTTNDALSLVWGSVTGGNGVDALLAPLDYSPIYNYVRSRLGAPIVPVELTDEQLGNLLAETITEYNRWRNYKEDLLYMNIPPGDNGGYTIPPVVGDPNNIVDVVFRPMMPFGYYQADADMASNLFMQYLFQKFGRPGQVGFLSDYWLALSTEKDMNLILGTEPRWEIIGDQLFITPVPTTSVQIGIKYRAALTINEILSDNLVKRYMLALAKILLGNIRSTFGNSIPGGTENIQLNGTDLVRQGEQELEKAEDQLIKQAEPQVLLIG